jgi:hypothetical protein
LAVVRVLVVLIVSVAAVLVVAGGSRDDPAPAPPRADAPRAADPTAAPKLRRARCPAGAANCAAVTGRVIYVESVDPDGDGDAHYVLAGGSVTGPGMTVIDVERRLRPKRLPRLGDRVSAAGPVYSGSYGQRQIEATEIHYER